jgi:hypothetical protein
MKHFFTNPANPTLVVLAAIRHVEWWGQGEHCLSVPANQRGNDGTSYGPGSKLEEAKEVCRQAPALVRLSGPRGAGRIIAVVGDRVAFVHDECGNCSWLLAEIGGFTRQKVAQYLLAPDSPSKWISGCYTGGAIALTPADAEVIGFGVSHASALPTSAEELALFGSNVELV